VAVPIMIDDRVVAALGIGCIAARVTLKVMVEDYLPKLKAAAAAISETLAASDRVGETIKPLR